jgi:hypothetical protein
MENALLKRDALLSGFVRSLIVNGYDVTGSQRQPTHIELGCEWKDAFGCTCNYLFVVCDEGRPSQMQLDAITHEASQRHQNVVIVTNDPEESTISRDDFFSLLGGAVPSWRALGPTYKESLLQSSTNELPKGYSGEAWAVFEQAVADGFEFIFGRRVRRLGGNKRGKRVSDMLAQLPDQTMLIIDTKASIHPFDASWKHMRALVEYTRQQLTRHKGIVELGVAIVVAATYKQENSAISNVSNDFVAETRIPLLFLTAEDLDKMVEKLAKRPQYRNRLNWRMLLCRNGRFEISRFSTELEDVHES